jgi:hypothetical protein
VGGPLEVQSISTSGLAVLTSAARRPISIGRHSRRSMRCASSSPKRRAPRDELQRAQDRLRECVGARVR